MTVAFEGERWYADRDRGVVAVERVAALRELEIVRVVFERGEPALYALVPEAPDWAELFAAATGAWSVDGDAPPNEPARRLDVDQSHTSWRVGDAYVKCYRRLVAGAHPEVELGRALSEAVPEHVARYRGSLHWNDVAVAVVQDFVPDAEDGWEWAAARAARGDAAFAAGAGRVARRIHDALAAAFPTRLSTAGDRATWRRAAEAQLEDARSAVGDEVADPRIASELARLGDGAEVTLTRVHGDLHIGQYLHSGDRVVVIDFEGQPGRPQRELDTPLRDLASLARSLDHCGRFAVERDGADLARIESWIDAARAELFTGYGRHDEELRSALEWERAVYEFTYAARYLPQWLYAPRGGLRALLST